jgi:pimeloyl-ACP methyl ester carboxylesterase
MYKPVKPSRTELIPIRGLQYQIRHWGSASEAPNTPPIVLLHGWMDVSASFQFMVDCLAEPRWIIAPDWRGYGGTSNSGADSYWFADYLADLEAIIDHYHPNAPIDLVAHSMGGNVACLYAGVRPERIRRLVNLEGYGLPDTKASQAPNRYARWLDEIKAGSQLRPYAGLADVAARLRKTNPRLREDFANWLAQYWSAPKAQADGTVQYELLADPAHKLSNPVLYRVEEVLACWRSITAPVLLVESEEQDEWHRFTRSPKYRERLNAFASLKTVTVEKAGHMLHHDQPQVVADHIEAFLK